MGKYTRRSVSLPPDVEEYVQGKEAQAAERGFQFVFSRFVAKLIEEKAREERQSQDG